MSYDRPFVGLIDSRIIGSPCWPNVGGRLAAPMAPLRIYLAGNVALERGEVLVPERALPGRQGRLALALLVTERRAGLPVEDIADVLWGDAPPPSWNTALRAIVSKLRGLTAEHGLGDAVAIESAFGCYQLRLP